MRARIRGGFPLGDPESRGLGTPKGARSVSEARPSSVGPRESEPGEKGREEKLRKEQEEVRLAAVPSGALRW